LCGHPPPAQAGQLYTDSKPPSVPVQSRESEALMAGGLRHRRQEPRLLRGLRAVDPFTPRTTHLRSAGDPLGGGLFIAASVLLAAYAAVLVSRDQRAANVVTTTVCVAWCHCVRRVCTVLFIIAECAECAECAEFV
jgi:hypothetical protein